MCQLVDITTWNCSVAIKSQRILNSYTNISLKLSTTLSVRFRFGAVQIYMPVNPWERAVCRPVTCKLTVLMNGVLCPETVDLLLRIINSSETNSLLKCAPFSGQFFIKYILFYICGFFFSENRCSLSKNITRELDPIFYVATEANQQYYCRTSLSTYFTIIVLQKQRYIRS